jgi:hypothetical protein
MIKILLVRLNTGLAALRKDTLFVDKLRGVARADKSVTREAFRRVTAAQVALLEAKYFAEGAETFDYTTFTNAVRAAETAVVRHGTHG